MFSKPDYVINKSVTTEAKNQQNRSVFFTKKYIQDGLVMTLFQRNILAEHQYMLILITKFINLS